MSTDKNYGSDQATPVDLDVSVSKDSDLLFTSGNMDILNDVDMQIVVEIGRAKMKISELLNLKHGSVIELAQAADEPLQIFANDKPIAKGTIISTNGKYCVKIM